jgi:hypothetical protein
MCQDRKGDEAPQQHRASSSLAAAAIQFDANCLLSGLKRTALAQVSGFQRRRPAVTSSISGWRPPRDRAAR